MTRYEPTRLYCLRCEEQPEYFHEMPAPHLVTPDGAHIEMYDPEALEYWCPQCGTRATWGSEIEEDRRKPHRGGRR